MNKRELIAALGADNFSEYYRLADALRRKHKGDTVHIRALLEFSNHCARRCGYCGLNAENKKLPRYRMSAAEIISACADAARAGYRTVVLQSGEDRSYTADMLCDIVSAVKRTGMAITLSCGELAYDDLRRLKCAGADRYLLKHETSSDEIYSALHPCGTLADRIQCLRNLKELGYEVGSGFMIGLPGQSLETIAEDLLLLKELECGMAGIGPFLPHPETRLGGHPAGKSELTRRAVALARILMPDINLPVTTALSVLDDTAQKSVFAGGANVVMQKITPDKYRALYEIYPTPKTKTNILKGREAIEGQILSLDRIPL